MRPTRAVSCWTGLSLQCVWTLLGLPLLCAARYLMALSYLPAWPDRYNVRRLHGFLGTSQPWSNKPTEMPSTESRNPNRTGG